MNKVEKKKFEMMKNRRNEIVMSELNNADKSETTCLK